MPENNDDPASRGFHWDKRIPIALILTVAIQTVVVGMWIGRLEQRVANLEEKESRTAQSDGPSRLVRVETQIDDVRRTIERMDSKVDRLLNRGASP